MYILEGIFINDVDESPDSNLARFELVNSRLGHNLLDADSWMKTGTEVIFCMFEPTRKSICSLTRKSIC